MNIAGSTTLITGGASGLGRATAERLRSAGGNVVLLDLEKSSGAGVAASLGHGALFAPGDVTSADDVAAALEAAVKRFGSIQGSSTARASARPTRRSASAARPTSPASRGSSRST